MPPSTSRQPRPAPGRRVDHTARRHTRPSWLLLAPVAVVTVLVVLAGVLLLAPGQDDADPADPPVAVPVATSMLLDPAAVQRLAPDRTWEVVGTGDNTTGDGINTVCQGARFADPDGEGTLVRRLDAPAAASDAASVRGRAGVDRSLLQTVEVSTTTESASDAFATTLGWFAGCEDGVQIVDAWQAQGLGTASRVLRLQQETDAGPRDLLVGVVRSDRVTVSLVARGPSGRGRTLPIDRFVPVLRAAVTRLCEADAAGFCPTRSRVLQVSAPLSGEPRGTLAVADLPTPSGVAAPWVGTRPEPARPNPAATRCDDAAFVRSGAPGATSRTYLVPQSDLPDRFGLTQTVGTFPGAPRARELVADVTAALADCEDGDLAVQVVTAVAPPARPRTSVAYWRVVQEVSEDRTVASWMGIARVGRHVTQVLFTPAGRADLDEQQFATVMDRARDRLEELEDSP